MRHALASPRIPRLVLMHRYIRAGLRIAFADLVQSVSALSPCFACAKFTLRITHPHILYRRIVGTPLIICARRSKEKRAVIKVRPVLPSLTALFRRPLSCLNLCALAVHPHAIPCRLTLGACPDSGTRRDTVRVNIYGTRYNIDTRHYGNNKDTTHNNDTKQ